MINRSNRRSTDELRPVKLTRNYTNYAEGSVLTEFGNTKVLCNVSFIEGVPKFLKGSKQGWLTAEYGMLPRATNTRSNREAVTGKQTSRSIEIQRLIGRSLRSVVDLTTIGENTLAVDCDVIQADGGTRTAAITGSCVALVDALQNLRQNHKITSTPFKQLIAAVSVGICDNIPLIDLDYTEDSKAETDMNVVMLENGDFIEIQGTAEKTPFSQKQLNDLLSLASIGLKQIFTLQHQVLCNL